MECGHRLPTGHLPCRRTRLSAPDQGRPAPFDPRWPAVVSDQIADKTQDSDGGSCATIVPMWAGGRFFHDTLAADGGRFSRPAGANAVPRLNRQDARQMPRDFCAGIAVIQSPQDSVAVNSGNRCRCRRHSARRIGRCAGFRRWPRARPAPVRKTQRLASPSRCRRRESDRVYRRSIVSAAPRLYAARLDG